MSDDDRVAELDLGPDGDLRLIGVPDQVLIPQGSVISDIDWSDTVDGVGTWEIADDGSVSLDIELEDGSFIVTYLYPIQRNGHVVLQAQLNASDIGDFVFERSESMS